MDKQTDLISRLQDEADLCRNDGASDIAALLDEAMEALRDRNHDTAVGEKWRTDSRLEEWFPLTAERLERLEQWARDCRDQVLYPAAQREDAIGKAAEGLGEWRLVAWVELDGTLVWHDRAAATGRNLYATHGA